MSTDRITYLDFTPDNPQPPPAALFMTRWLRQTALEARDYEWKRLMSQQYPQTLPITIPFWYSRKHTMRHAYGLHPGPVDTVADIRARLDKSYRRLGLVAYADAVDSSEGLAA